MSWINFRFNLPAAPDYSAYFLVLYSNPLASKELRCPPSLPRPWQRVLVSCNQSNRRSRQYNGVRGLFVCCVYGLDATLCGSLTLWYSDTRYPFLGSRAICGTSQTRLRLLASMCSARSAAKSLTAKSFSRSASDSIARTAARRSVDRPPAGAVSRCTNHRSAKRPEA